MLISLSSLLVAALLLPLAASDWMRRRSNSRTLTTLEGLPADARIVVLGCPTRGRKGQPNRYFVERIAAAAAAYHHLREKTDSAGNRLLCSGWDERGEATDLRDALIASRVPANRITVDGEARRTIDTIDFVAAHFQNEPIVFVSQAFHLPRVLFLSENRGIDAWALPAAGRLRGLRPRLRESLAQLRAILDLNFLRRE